MLPGRMAAKANEPGLVRMQCQFELAQTLVQIVQERPGLVLMLKANDEESRPRESHPQALAEPYVKLSPHTAPIVRPCPYSNRQ
jgi:hypothetical protein